MSSRDLLASLWTLGHSDRLTVRQLLSLSTPLDRALDEAGAELGRLSDQWSKAYLEWARAGRPAGDECRLLDSLCDAFERAQQRHNQLVAAAWEGLTND